MPTRAPSRAAQQRAAHVAAKQAAAAARRRRRVVLSAVLATLAVAAVVGIVVGTRSGSGPVSSTPAGVTAAGGVLVGSSSAPVKVIAYEDLQCPVCGRFERQSGVLLKQAVAAGKVSVEYRIRSFLGPESVRAANGLGAAQAEGKFEALREALYSEQPAEGTGGYSVDTLISTGRDVGLASSSYADAVRSGRYDAWVRATDDRASRDGNVQTPELRVAGRALTQAELFDAAALSAALGI